MLQYTIQYAYSFKCNTMVLAIQKITGVIDLVCICAHTQTHVLMHKHAFSEKQIPKMIIIIDIIFFGSSIFRWHQPPYDLDPVTLGTLWPWHCEPQPHQYILFLRHILFIWSFSFSEFYFSYCLQWVWPTRFWTSKRRYLLVHLGALKTVRPLGNIVSNISLGSVTLCNAVI